MARSSGDRQRADELRPVDEDDRADRSCDRADGRDVGAVPGRGLHAAERDEHGAAVDVARRRRRVRARRCGTGPGGPRTPCARASATGSGSSCTRAAPITTLLPRRGRTELRGDQPGRSRHGRDQARRRRGSAPISVARPTAARARRRPRRVTKSSAGLAPTRRRRRDSRVEQRSAREAHRRGVEVRRCSRSPGTSVRASRMSRVGSVPCAPFTGSTITSGRGRRARVDRDDAGTDRRFRGVLRWAGPRGSRPSPRRSGPPQPDVRRDA